MRGKKNGAYVVIDGTSIAPWHVHIICLAYLEENNFPVVMFSAKLYDYFIKV